MPIGPGVIWLIATMLVNSAVDSQWWLCTVSICMSDSMPYPPPKPNSPILKNVQKSCKNIIAIFEVQKTEGQNRSLEDRSLEDRRLEDGRVKFCQMSIRYKAMRNCNDWTSGLRSSGLLFCPSVFRLPFFPYHLFILP